MYGYWCKLTCKSIYSRQLLQIIQVIPHKVSYVTVFLHTLLLSFFLSLQDNVYKLHRLEDGPSREVEVSRTDLLQFYREMNIIREMENSARTLYQEKKIRGFLHVYIGQVRVPYNISVT